MNAVQRLACRVLGIGALVPLADRLQKDHENVPLTVRDFDDFLAGFDSIADHLEADRREQDQLLYPPIGGVHRAGGAVAYSGMDQKPS